MQKSLFSYQATLHIPDSEGSWLDLDGMVEVQYRDLIEAKGKIYEYLTHKHGAGVMNLEIEQVQSI